MSSTFPEAIQLGLHFGTDTPKNFMGTLWTSASCNAELAAPQISLSDANDIWLLALASCKDREHLRATVLEGVRFPDGAYGLSDYLPIPAVGSAENDITDGQGRAPLSRLFDPRAEHAPSTWVRVSGFGIQLEEVTEGRAEGTMGFGTPAEYAAMAIFPGLAAMLTDFISFTTTNPGACSNETYRGVDRNEDGIVTVAELEDPLFQGNGFLFGEDIDLFDEHEDPPQYAPGRDGGLDHMAVGFKFIADRIELRRGPDSEL